MVETASQADVAWNDELWIGPIGPGTAITEWTQVLGIEEVAMPEKAPEDVDATHMQSPGRSRETIPGMLPVADFSQDLQFWPAHASQVLLGELADLTEAGNEEHIRIEFNVGGLRRTYRGYVNAFNPTGTVGDMRMANVTFKIFERVSPNPRVIA